MSVRRALPVLLLLVGAPSLLAQKLPNLDVDREELARSLGYELVSFAPEACVRQPSDYCVDGVGARKLLRFGVFARNTGTADVVLGAPASNPGLFVFSACHGHFHFDNFARYELRPRGLPDAIVAGQKRAFCVQDSQSFSAVPRPCLVDADCAGRGRCGPGRTCRYDCQHQGIQVGFGDYYPRTLDCQWLDVTDVPPGAYDVAVLLNPARVLPESDFGDNLATVGVTLEGPSDLNPAPAIRLRAPRTRRPRRVGRRLAVKWRVRPGAEVKLQEVWVSRDAGATYELVAGQLPPDTQIYRWMIPPTAATRAARIKVVAWSTGLQRGTAVSPRFRIVR
jgi:hypothetical protein